MIVTYSIMSPTKFSKSIADTRICIFLPTATQVLAMRRTWPDVLNVKNKQQLLSKFARTLPSTNSHGYVVVHLLDQQNQKHELTLPKRSSLVALMHLLVPENLACHLAVNGWAQKESNCIASDSVGPQHLKTQMARLSCNHLSTNLNPVIVLASLDQMALARARCWI